MKTLLVAAGVTLAGIGSAVVFAPFAAARRPPPPSSGDEPLVVELPSVV